MKKIKKFIKQNKERFNYRKLYKDTKLELKKEYEKNVELQKKIDYLEFMLDEDFQVQKIRQLEGSLDYYRGIKRVLRQEIIELKEKIK